MSRAEVVAVDDQRPRPRRRQNLGALSCTAEAEPPFPSAFGGACVGVRPPPFASVPAAGSSVQAGFSPGDTEPETATG